MNRTWTGRQVSLVVSVLLLALYAAPYLLLGGNGSFLIHDNLDGSYIAYKLVLDNGVALAGNSHPVEQIFNGLPRSALPSEFDFGLWLHALLGPLGAYIANRIIMLVVGFTGMYLLLRRHVIPGEGNHLVQCGAALCFALLPFWPFGALSIAGLPLVVHAFLNVRQGDARRRDWLVIFSYAFYSSLFLSGFFLLACLGLLWLWDAAHRRPGSRSFFLALLLLSFAYVLTHYRLFASLVSADRFLSHRVEFAAPGHALAQSVRAAVTLFTTGQYHALSLHTYVILPIVLVGAVVILRQRERRATRMLVGLLVFLVLTSAWYGLLQWSGVETVRRAVTAVLPMDLGRFYFLHPLAWTVLFALSLAGLLRTSRKAWVAVLGVLVLQLCHEFTRHELFANRAGPSVKQFYAERQFKAIADFVGQDPSSYRVASLGLHPAVSLYNGFHTLDAYASTYPMAYKRAFRTVIAAELEQSDPLKRYYDEWGSRVYLFSSELWKQGNFAMNMAGNQVEVQQFRIDTQAFRRMGGRYVISAVKINEALNPSLRLRKSFKDEESAWDIYLYEVAAAP